MELEMAVSGIDPLPWEPCESVADRGWEVMVLDEPVVACDDDDILSLKRAGWWCTGCKVGTVVGGCGRYVDVWLGGERALLACSGPILRTPRTRCQRQHSNVTFLSSTLIACSARMIMYMSGCNV